jgi:hypothetical protein
LGVRCSPIRSEGRRLSGPGAYAHITLRNEYGEIHLARRTPKLPALIVAAVLMACAVVVLVVSEKAEATFPGKIGRIAYSAFDRGPDDTI